MRYIYIQIDLTRFNSYRLGTTFFINRPFGYERVYMPLLATIAGFSRSVCPRKKENLYETRIKFSRLVYNYFDSSST